MEQEIEKEIIRGKKSFSNVLALWILITIIGFIIAYVVHWNYATKSSYYADIGKMYAFFIMSITIILDVVIYYIFRENNIFVTNNRVYGKTILGKRIDLPLDSISAVGISFLQGIDVGTSSGRIHFKFLENTNDILKEISKLLNNRQSNKNTTTIANNNSNADELKKYKELLDSGVITQEEFDTKKKQLLNL